MIQAPVTKSRLQKNGDFGDINISTRAPVFSGTAS